MSSTSRIVRIVILICGPCVLSTAASAHGVVSVKARTSDEIVNAVLAANRSGKRTIINVAPGDYRFSQVFESEGGGSALPPVTGTVLIVGRDASTTRFLESTRFITVMASGNLLVRGITLTRSSATCSETLEDCSGQGGGAALNRGGLLWIEDCVLADNTTYQPTGGQTFGGAVLSTGGHLHIGNTSVTGNRSLFAAGGIAITGGTATLRNSIVSGNRTARGNAFNEASFFGAGLYITGSKVWIFDSTISGNIMAEVPNADVDRSFGTGIYNGNGTVWLVRSAVTENFGGQLGFGGGILNGGRMFITDSTIGGNTIGTRGGGIYNYGTLTLQGVTIAHNEEVQGYEGVPGLRGFPDGCDFREAPENCGHGGGGIWNEPAGTVYMSSSVVASNTALVDRVLIPAQGPDCAGVIISNGHNLIANNAGCQLQPAPNAAPDKVNLNPLLGDLTDNGVVSEIYFPILPGSPLIDAGGKVRKDCGPYDQLGHRRNDGNHDGKAECDVGAVEYRAPRPH